MLPPANLIDGIRLWVSMFLVGPADLGYLSGDYGDNLKAFKTTLYLPFITPSDEAFNKTHKIFELAPTLKSLNIISFEMLKVDDPNEFSNKMTLQWNYKCGTRTSSIRLPLKWKGNTFVPDFEHRILGIAIYRCHVIHSSGYIIVQFSISLPVTEMLIGEHTFMLLNSHNQVVRQSPSVLLRPEVNCNNNNVLI